MSGRRKIPLVTGEIYHIFNRGIDKRVTFVDSREYARALNVLGFYRFSSPPMRLSRFLKLKKERMSEVSKLSWGNKIVSVFCFCLMPNHFHLVLRQETDQGISRFMSQFLNSYTRYFNTKNKRIGQLFLDQFKNVLIGNENQLLHISRYVHLNPYSSQKVSNLGELTKYKWSSLPEYLDGKTQLCDQTMILSYFKTRKEYGKFVFDNADYQKELKRIEHLVLE